MMVSRTIRADDIDGTEPAREVRFGLDGVDYLIDLGRDNEKLLHDALAMFVANAHKAPPRVTVTPGPIVRQHRAGGAPGQAAAIRRWAREQGIDVPERGRLPREVIDAYRAGHA